jgi:nitrogenase subunit NifH
VRVTGALGDEKNILISSAKLHSVNIFPVSCIEAGNPGIGAGCSLSGVVLPARYCKSASWENSAALVVYAFVKLVYL